MGSATLASEGARARTERISFVAALRARLAAVDYATVYRLSAGGLYQRALAPSVRETTALLPRSTRACLALFVLDDAVPRTEIEDALGGDLVAALEAARVLVPRDAHTMSSCYRVDITGDTWLLTENYRARPDGVYFGEDSQFLHAMLEPQRGSICLDLCTGSGVQGLRLAATAHHVDCVDLNPRAVQLAAMNAALNGVSDRVSVHCGDLWEALPDDAQYDLIVANPPLVPVPDGVPYPLCGDGGSDGLTLVRRLLAPLPDRLGVTGRATVIGASTGDSASPMVGELGRSLQVAGLDVTLYLLFRLPLYDWIGQVATAAATMQPGYRAARAVGRARAVYGAALEHTHVYTYLLKVARPTREPRFQVVDYSGTNRRSYWFVGTARE